MINKAALKHLLGDLPLTAELYWQLRQNGKPLSKSFSLRRTERRLDAWRAQVEASRPPAPDGKKVLIFAALRYWIEHATLLGMALSGLGHAVTLAYLPYANWRKEINRFDSRRHNIYARSVLKKAAPWLQAVSFLDLKGVAAPLDPQLDAAVRAVSLRDAQYTLQVETVDPDSELYRLRVERNLFAARAALAWCRANSPDVILTPNGSILEMGAVFEVARFLEIPVVTYEFGEQRGRIWLARNAEVMRQETDALWAARGGQALSGAQLDKVRELFASRQKASLWENFSRRWQGQPSQGGERACAALGLDRERPLALLAANVIGDSLTLGRQVFTESMTEWLEHTVRYFAACPEVQLVVRIHPGERYTQGPSVADVVRRALPEVPPHVHLVAFDAPVNTYDLVEIADLGLVYTTTVGMEMAMSGVPAVVIGQTHYRGKGFTLDPASWEEYDQLLERALADPAKYRLSREQVDCAWNYAYRFFFEYPLPFPWHLLHFWNELEEWPLSRVLSDQGQAEYREAFGCLVGAPRDWTKTVESLSERAQDRNDG